MSRVIKGGTFCTTASLLTATGSETVHDSTVLLQYCINGKAYQKSGTNADQATPTTDYNTGLAFPTMGASTGAVVVWAYNAAGTVKCIMSAVQSLDASGNFVKIPDFPPVPNDVCPFAYQVLKVDSTGSGIVFGTSNWDATGFTNAIVDVLVLPARPQAS